MDCYNATPNLRPLFYFVSVFGGSVALVSVAFNLTLLLTFLSRPLYRQQMFVYFIALAVADILLSLLYILLFSNSYIWEYLNIVWLFHFWHRTVRFIHPISHMVQFTIPYILVVASVERYLNKYTRVRFSSRHRFLAIFGVVLFAVASKLSTHWEIELEYRANCTGFGAIHLELGPLRRLESYNVYFVFWYRNIANVFAPFFILISLYLRLVAKDVCAPIARLPCIRAVLNCCNQFECWKKTKHDPVLLDDEKVRSIKKRVGSIGHKTSLWVRRARTRVRKAVTRTLIAIVIEYLLCHSPTFVVTVWEHVDMKSLRAEYRDPYSVLVEVINFLNLFASAIRLPTLLYCDVTFRKELARRFMRPFKAANANGYLSDGGNFENLVMNAIATKKMMKLPNMERLL